MAVKYLIQTIEPVPVLDSDGNVTSYTNGISNVDSYDPSDANAITFVIGENNGWIAKDRVRFVTPYTTD